jgi:hypothetical protein
MTDEQNNAQSSFEFNIQEGAFSEHHEILQHGHALHWSVSADYGYDIEFSIIVRSRLNGFRGTWVVFEKERVINRDGYINASDLQDDGIKLPVSVEFRMDNSYSWFNPKRVYLNIKRALDVPTAEDTESVARPGPSVQERPVLPSITEDTLRRMREGKNRIDLLWLNHVIGEALMRVPDSVPGVQEKLEDIKSMLVPHVQKSGTNHAVI